MTLPDARAIRLYDTTLRDGLGMEGLSLSLQDKLLLLEKIDELGVHYIEGGWPGANPKDIEFFNRAATELRLPTSTMVAFGSTRRPRGKVDDDATLRNLIEAETSAVCIVAKSSEYQVVEALKTSLDEGAAMIADSVRFLHGEGRMVMVDLEHFFDGYKAGPEFSLRAIEAAVGGGDRVEPFRYRDKGSMATIGRNAAVVELPRGPKITGFPGWVAWLSLHLIMLIGFRNRANVLVNWAWNYLTYDRGSRLIIDPEPDLNGGRSRAPGSRGTGSGP